MKYYIQRPASGYHGNYVVWWRKKGTGYTCNINDAEIFDGDSDDFKSIIKDSKYKAWPKNYVDKRTSVHVDMQNLDFKEAFQWDQHHLKAGRLVGASRKK